MSSFVSAPKTPATALPIAPIALPAPDAAAPTAAPTPNPAIAAPTATNAPATFNRLPASILARRVISSTIAVIAPETESITMAIPSAIEVINPEIASPIAVITDAIASPTDVTIDAIDMATFTITSPIVLNPIITLSRTPNIKPPRTFANFRRAAIRLCITGTNTVARPMTILPQASINGVTKLRPYPSGINASDNKASAAAPAIVTGANAPNKAPATPRRVIPAAARANSPQPTPFNKVIANANGTNEAPNIAIANAPCINDFFALSMLLAIATRPAIAANPSHAFDQSTFPNS